MNTTWMTVREVAAYLRLSRDLIYRWVQEGKIPASKVGGQWRFRRERIDQWMEEQGRPLPKTEEAKLWERVLRSFIQRLRETYADALKGVHLYGSRARQDADEGSDVDLLVVLGDYTDFWKEFHRIQDIAYDVSFGAGHDVVLSALPIKQEEYETGGSPFLLNVRREGAKVA
ncbi:MAG: helix-turn-helix domain-containing protein [Candidatus Methylomirabilales bacterium]